MKGTNHMQYTTVGKPYAERYERSTAITRPPIRITLPAPAPKPRWRMVCTFGIIALGLWLVGYGLAGLCFLGIMSILSTLTRWYPGTTPDRVYRMRVGDRLWRLYGDEEFNRWNDKDQTR
jgi:hypothetical protein